jgi:hypothetical protein
MTSLSLIFPFATSWQEVALALWMIALTAAVVLSAVSNALTHRHIANQLCELMRFLRDRNQT